VDDEEGGGESRGGRHRRLGVGGKSPKDDIGLGNELNGNNGDLNDNDENDIDAASLCRILLILQGQVGGRV
jgi:hypothetical protein